MSKCLSVCPDVYSASDFTGNFRLKSVKISFFHEIFQIFYVKIHFFLPKNPRCRLWWFHRYFLNFHRIFLVFSCLVDLFFSHIFSMDVAFLENNKNLIFSLFLVEKSVFRAFSAWKTRFFHYFKHTFGGNGRTCCV